MTAQTRCILHKPGRRMCRNTLCDPTLCWVYLQAAEAKELDEDDFGLPFGLASVDTKEVKKGPRVDTDAK